MPSWSDMYDTPELRDAGRTVAMPTDPPDTRESAPAKCPQCKGRNIRKATVYWQCLICGHSWLDDEQTLPERMREQYDANGEEL
jgi:ribosomal protein L37AE/L43A